ncbi:MAG: LPS-assembly protein LptD, partial [Treponema sp.]|nr:LPS-assembly protein LptD [Treponema sp.]
LLPGNDWAILNAVLKVGNIPLLYLPFFYYPADEIVFHPVLGYRTREGTFLQTTTYILGRPTASTIAENSITKIFGGATDGDKKREGVFLRTTGAKTINPNETQLSLLFDAYVNLGAYLGTELALPGKGALGKITLSAGLGFTRDIFPTQYSFTPFPRYDGTWNYNWGMLFSLKVPFRYRFETAGSYQIKYGSFSWNIPYYSDPYVKRDFMRRSEVLDWLAMLRETGTPPPEDETAMSSYELTSYTWSLNGSLNNLPVTSLNPYVQSFSISPVSISLVFNPRDSVKYSQPPGPNTLSNPLSPNLPNPGKSFFVPSRFTIYNISASVTGTPFAWGNLQAPQLKAAAGPAPGDTLLPDAPLSPWDTGAGQGSDKTKAAAKAVQDTFALSPPALSQTFPLTAAGAPRVSVDYSFSPSAASELQFRSNRTNWKEQEDINWGEISTVLSSFQGDGNLGLTVSQSGGSAYSGYFRLRGRGSWQDYVYLNEKAEELSPVVGTPTPADIKKARDDAYTRTNFSSSWDLSASMKPFYQSPVWNATSLQYSLQGILGKTTVDTTGNSPKWDWVNGKWDKDNISSHQITANLGATVMDYAQNISVSAVLPPRDSSLSTNATFRAWITETSFRNQIQKPLEDGQVIGPVYLTETLNFGSLGSFRQDVVFDPKQNQYTTFTSSLTLSGFLASFSAVYAYQYRFNPLYGSPSQALWSLQTNQALEPQQFRLGYSKTFTKTDLWGKRLNFSVGINTDLSFDLQRYTNSRFSFLPAIKLQVAHFLDLTFSTRSENGVMYRYFQKWPLFRSPPSGFPDLYAGYETNFFKDLFNSFRFDNADIRRKSGFKLRSLDLSLTHYLGSWVATLTMSTQPYLAPGSRTYKFTNNISFLIQWNPIGEIKAQIDYNQDGLKVK